MNYTIYSTNLYTIANRRDQAAKAWLKICQIKESKSNRYLVKHTKVRNSRIGDVNLKQLSVDKIQGQRWIINF